MGKAGAGWERSVRADRLELLDRLNVGLDRPAAVSPLRLTNGLTNLLDTTTRLPPRGREPAN
jgi:hypothetical protein